MNDLSIIIPSYNTKTITLNCLESIFRSLENSSLDFEVIVVDNASTDETIKEIKNLKLKIKNYNSKLKVIENETNVGFARANNQAVKKAQGKYLLFLNSDVIIDNLNFKKIIALMEKDEKIGVSTVKVILSNGKTDPACHRGFPTLWRSFCYFSGLEKVLGNLPILNRILGGYHLTYLDKDKVHEIDSPSGAFYLIRKKIFDQVGGFDERFFMYGEDLDLSYQVKKLGYKIIFYPLSRVLHLKYQSGLAGNDQDHQKKIKRYFYQAMKIFYQKNYAKHSSVFFNTVVYFLIDLKEKLT